MDLVHDRGSMDLVHDRGSMDLVHERGPWTWSMKVVHGPGPKRGGSMDLWSMSCPHQEGKSDLRALAGNYIRLYLTSSIQILPSGSLDKLQ